MATNPFENENGVYHVLVNDEGQHSIWPAFVPAPNGWNIVHKSDTRAGCLDFVEKNWTDLRPKSLIKAMDAGAEAGEQQPAAQQTDSGQKLLH
jgi:MbtH protein